MTDRLTLDQAYALGMRHISAGRLEQAEDLLLKVVEVVPEHPEVLCNVGVLYIRKKEFERATGYLEKASRLKENYTTALLNLAVAYTNLFDYDAAEKLLLSVLDADPRSIEAISNLGELQRGARRYGEAIAAFTRALDIAKTSLEGDKVIDAIHFNLALSLDGAGREQEAYEHFSAAYRRKPDFEKYAVRMLRSSRTFCDWSDLQAREQAVHGLASANNFGDTLEIDDSTLMYSPLFSGLDLRRVAEQLSRRILRASRSAGVARRPTTPSCAGRVRIGYILADAREHANGWNSELIFGLHDRSQYEVFVYSTGENDRGAVRQRMEAGAEHFIDLHGKSDEAIANRISSDEIGILVDLMGHTRNNSLKALAMRPAPIQINYLGFPGTTGAPFIDYIIGDSVVTPLSHAEHFSEAIIQLPECYQANNLRLYELPQAPARAQLGLPDGAFVFCCFNATNKFTPDRFEAWVRILRASPGAVLWLFAPNDMVRRNLLGEAARRGLAPDRVVFADSRARPEHLRRMQAADLFLDTSPVGAHTTASDALWAGVPVLTALGETFPARVTASVVRAAGLGDLVMPDEATYEARAIELANDRDAIEALKSRLRRARATCPLFDMQARVRELEAAYAVIWARHCEGLPPAPVSIAPQAPVADR